MPFKTYDSGYRGACRKEDAEQIDCVAWVRHHYQAMAKLLMHPPNESKVPVQYRAQLSKMGILPGASDLILLYPASGHPYALFELKRCDRTKSRLSAAQRGVLDAADAVGAFASVCYGFDQFKLAFIDYIG
jgi:hypothetical protein